jgi:hypothetical protein
MNKRNKTRSVVAGFAAAAALAAGIAIAPAASAATGLMNCNSSQQWMGNNTSQSYMYSDGSCGVEKMRTTYNVYGTYYTSPQYNFGTIARLNLKNFGGVVRNSEHWWLSSYYNLYR